MTQKRKKKRKDYIKILQLLAELSRRLFEIECKLGVHNERSES